MAVENQPIELTETIKVMESYGQTISEDIVNLRAASNDGKQGGTGARGEITVTY